MYDQGDVMRRVDWMSGVKLQRLHGFLLYSTRYINTEVWSMKLTLHGVFDIVKLPNSRTTC
jgi:hypothetical protein